MSHHVLRIGELGKEMGQELHVQVRPHAALAGQWKKHPGGGCNLWCNCVLAVTWSWALHPQGQLLDELDQEVEGTSTRIAAAQVRVEAAEMPLRVSRVPARLAVLYCMDVKVVLHSVLAISPALAAATSVAHLARWH